MSEPVVVGNRVELSRTTGVLAVGDVLAILAFVVAGMVQHGTLTDPVALAETALPFLVGWALAATFTGAFAPAVLRTARETAFRTGLAWLAADLIGQALRATPVFDGGFALPFFVVSLAVGGVLLVGWRVLAQRLLL